MDITYNIYMHHLAISKKYLWSCTKALTSSDTLLYGKSLKLLSRMFPIACWCRYKDWIHIIIESPPFLRAQLSWRLLLFNAASTAKRWRTYVAWIWNILKNKKLTLSHWSKEWSPSINIKSNKGNCPITELTLGRFTEVQWHWY